VGLWKHNPFPLDSGNNLFNPAEGGRIMNIIQVWLPKLSMVVGIFSIILLSCDDFRKNVRKFISRWRYYLAGSIFIAINLFTYLVLSYAVVQQSPSSIIFGVIKIDGNYLDMLMPLLLAFVYFGAGAGSFRLGNKEFQLNKKLRDTLEGMFNSKPLGLNDVRYPEKQTEKLYTLLREKVEKVQPVAIDKKYDRLLVQWNEFKEDELVLKEQMDYLKKINKELVLISTDLVSESPAAGKLLEVMQNIQERINNILKSLIKKAQKLLVAFAFEYYKDEVELEEYLVSIEVLDPTQDPLPYIPSVINRGLILGFMFGLLFGPLFGIFKNEDVIYYCWRGAVVLMLFTGCVSYGVKCKNWKKTVVVAGMGGYIAHFFWNLIDKTNLGELMQGTWGWIMDPVLYKEPIVGLSYGITTALILYAFKYRIVAKVRNKNMLYAMAALSGAVSYPILNLLIKSQLMPFDTWILTAAIGAIAMSSLSVAVNIANRANEPLNQLRPEEQASGSA
jgi:hypothetical protein